MNRIVWLLCILFFFTACCPVQPGGSSRGALPGAITLGEQGRRLEEWRRGMPVVKATIGTAGVHLQYADEQGRMQSHNAEGTLMLQQHFDAAAGSAMGRGDVYLRGTAFDQKVFEAGRNASDWWFSIYLDNKTARTGDASVPVNLAGLSSGGSSSIFRADLVFDLLGLSSLPSGAGGTTVMRVNDDAGTNDLFVIGGGGGGWIMREIVVDRYTGYVVGVRLYDSAGVVVVRSELSDYAAVTYAEGVERPSVVAQFPRRVVLSYPAQKTVISLKFDEVMVRGGFPPAAFSTPDFGKENLRVIRGE